MTVATNFMVPTESQPYLAIPGFANIGFKPMSFREEAIQWSAVVRIEAGTYLPARRTDSLSEVFVVRGSGILSDGQAFQYGDYLREENGDFQKIKAHSELVVFFTSHGKSAFLDDDGNVLLEMDHKTQIDQFSAMS